jgi:gluconokinase
MRVIHDEATAPVATVPPGLWCYRADRRHALVGGATSEGGNVYGWVRSIANLGAPDEIEAALAAFPPDGHGLTVLPFLAGERSPGWAGNVRAVIDGLSLDTTPIAILRASLEAVAYRLAVVHQRLCDRPGCTHRLVANGSALLNSPAWVQIFADVMGRPVVASLEAEATSRGAALLALRGLGVLSSFADAPAADGRVFEPDAGRHALYQAAIVRQQELYDRLIAARAM